jgi:signal transduction histidine kinase
LVDVTKGQNESLLNFAHIVSHNLRSHATNMTMLTNFLRMEMDVEEKQNIVEMLNKASESLNDTVQHLNEVVQVKTSATEKLTALNLQESIKKVKNNLLAVIHESKAECIMKIPKAIKVEVVPAYLDSILLNLFTNAIKYQDPGRQLKLKVSAKRSNGYIVVDFCDNGLGIDLERHQDKLFGMYKTFHTHKDAKGIGLFITKNQIEAMDGKIEVTSKVGEGSTFTIYLKEA